MNTPDPKLLDMLHAAMEIMAMEYEQAWTPAVGDEMLCGHMMSLVKNDYSFNILPREIANRFFASSHSKSLIPKFAETMITVSNQEVIGLLVVTEAWVATQKPEEAKERLKAGGDVRSTPGAKTAIIGCIYNAKEVFLYAQPMDEGKRCGPVIAYGDEERGGGTITGPMVPGGGEA